MGTSPTTPPLIPYTLGDLVAELQPILWPSGEASNLVGAHHAMFIEALVDLQQWVECLQINNVYTYPQCNTLFKCGLTALDAPRGRIRKLYLVDRINQTTGLEDAAVPTDWCSDVVYQQVDFSDLDRYVSQTLAGTLDAGFFAWYAALFAGYPLLNPIALPQAWFGKYTYPPPTDAGLSGAAPLPLGYHYGQPSTDNKPGRAQYGMWAIKGGQIFIAPWMQSTEMVVVECDGLKRNWQDTDLIDNDPILKSAVEAYVRKEHARKYDHDYADEQSEEKRYNELRARLMYECEMENKQHDDNVSSKARGAGDIVPTYVNVAQTATANCPNGQTGQSVTYTVPAGTVVSLISVADANARAASLALQTAGSQLVCTTPAPSWKNATQTYTAQCGANGTGTPVTVTIQAGTVTSLISQQDADAQALAQAQAQAQSQLVCTWSNTAQTATANCPSPHQSTVYSSTTPAGTYTSSVSLADANSQALTAAQNAANAQLSGCPVPPVVYWNTVQQSSANVLCYVNGIPQIVPGSGLVQPNTISSPVSQAEANSIAKTLANTLALENARQNCANEGGRL